MSDECGNCGAEIRENTTWKSGNYRKSDKTREMVNFVTSSNFPDLCEKCGAGPIAEAYGRIDTEISERSAFFQNHITDFPMFTVSWLPAHADVKLKNMVTANITVGTGLFSEFSQGLSDMVGAVNTSSGMTHKVNKGEAAARSILIDKAVGMGANCLIAVDVDYGVTANNAATINMQATAAFISNLDAVLDAADFERAQALREAFDRIGQLRRWRGGHDIPERAQAG